MRLFYFFILFTIIYFSDSARILFVPGHNGASHTKSMYPAAEALVRAGHQVYMLQLIHDRKEECRNKAGVVDLIIHTIRDDLDTDDDSTVEFLSKLMWTMQSTSSFGFIFMWKMTSDVCSMILSQTSTREKFHKIVDEPWDAVLVDDFFAPCGLVGIQKSWADRGVVVVDFSTTTLLPHSLLQRGVHVPYSVVANFKIPIYENDRFYYRLCNAWDFFQYELIYRMLTFLVPYWGRGTDLGDIEFDILARKSLFAVTSVPTKLDFTAPTAMDVLNLDMACPTPDPLQEPMKNFVEDPSSRGTILFAMGHYADWTYAPPGAVDAFIEAFGRLSRFRIIWQFASKSMKPKNVSGNVLVESWVPQAAVLGHPKTKLFISHMGLKSMRESVCARVPTSGMPMFAEQYRNTAISRRRGFGVFLDKMNLTADGVYETLKRVLDNEKYGDSVRRLQDQLEDRILDPLDLLAFDVEFYARRGREDILNRFIRIKWNVPVLARWRQMDFFVPVLIGFVGLLCFIL